MPSSDFYKCMLLESIEPFGGRRGDLQAGIIASTLANVMGSGKKTYAASDFMPFETESKDQPSQGSGNIIPTQSPEEMHARFLMFKAGYENMQKKNA